MNTQRISLEDLRAKIDEFRVLADVKPMNDAAMIRAMTASSAAWYAAYLWHVGVMNGLMLAHAQQDVEVYEARDRERQEGCKLIRERLA